MLRPFWQKHRVLFKITIFLALIFSPIVVPALVLYNNRDQVNDSFKELFDAVFKNKY